MLTTGASILLFPSFLPLYELDYCLHFKAQAYIETAFTFNQHITSLSDSVFL